MKRLLACVMAVLLVFSMSGCAQDTSIQDAETVVTKYYDQLKKGEFDEATKLCTSDVSDDNEYGIITDSMDQMIEEMSTSFDFNDSQNQKVKDAANQFAKNTVKQYVRSYEIQKDDTSVNDDKNKVTVKVTIKGIDMNSFTNVTNDASITNSIQEKYEPKMESLQANNATDEQINDLMVEIISDLFNTYGSKLDGLKSVEHKEKLTLAKKDNTWKIKKISVSEKENATNA